MWYITFFRRPTPLHTAFEKVAVFRLFLKHAQTPIQTNRGACTSSSHLAFGGVSSEQHLHGGGSRPLVPTVSTSRAANTIDKRHHHLHCGISPRCFLDLPRVYCCHSPETPSLFFAASATPAVKQPGQIKRAQAYNTTSSDAHTVQLAMAVRWVPRKTGLDQGSRLRYVHCLRVGEMATTTTTTTTI